MTCLSLGLPQEYQAIKTTLSGSRQYLSQIRGGVNGVGKHDIDQCEKAWIQGIIDSILDDGVVALDQEKKVIITNDAAKTIIGCGNGSLVGREIDMVFPPVQTIFSDPDEVSRQRHWTTWRSPNGLERQLCISVKPLILKNRTVGFVVILRDYTEQAKREQELSYLEKRDRLTGLYNRDYTEVLLEQIDRPENLPLSVIMGDFNGLKHVNDMYGYDEGNRVLGMVSKVLTESCPRGVVSRWGGDEFVVFLPRTDLKTATSLSEEIRRECETIHYRSGLSISLGVSAKVEPGESIDSVLRKAENWMYGQKLLNNHSVRSCLISSLERSLREKSFETEEHCRRIQQIAVKVGTALDLAPNQISELSLLSLLHDIGKIAIPEQILNKKAPLTDLEWEIIKKHPETGWRIAQASEELSSIAEGILAHHERWDGKGYPRGLKGDQIPLIARILAIVDAYDVLTKGRPYRKPLTKDEALQEICRCSGTQFDPKLVKVFLKVVGEKEYSRFTGSDSERSINTDNPEWVVV